MDTHKKRAKCPNGTRKNKITGECEKLSIKNGDEVKSKPKKTKKNRSKNEDVINEKIAEVVTNEKMDENVVNDKEEEVVNNDMNDEDAVQEDVVQEDVVDEDVVDEDVVVDEDIIDEEEEYYGKENDTLKENEKREYYTNLKTPGSKTDFLYPSLGNPYLNKYISLQKNFAHLKYDGEIKDKHDIKKISDMICENPDFELLPHQLFVKGFMSSQTPYQSILLYHGLGSGKTCSAIGISEEMRSYTKQTGIHSRIFIVASPNVQENFKLQLFDERKLKQTNGIWSLNTCVGTQILNEINPTNSPMEREKIVSQVKKIIDREYKFMGYLQFANYIDEKIKVVLSANVSSAEKELIKKHFSDSLVIIDEVHNCTKESKSLSIQLKKLAKHADNLKFILLSATPMYNSPREIIWITNLMNLNDGRSAIKYSDVFDEDGNIIESTEDEGANLLLRKLNGYVSYVRGENPFTFPFRVYPQISEQQFTAIGSGEKVDVPLQGKLYLTSMKGNQKKVYDLVIKKSLDSGDGFFYTNNVLEDLENMERYGYTKLQAPLQSLIITFPHKDLDNIIANEEDRENYKELFGQKGLQNVMKYEKKDGAQPEISKFEYKTGILPGGNHRIFSETELPKYSAKISSICDCIRASADRIVNINGLQTIIHGGIILVYTQYIYGGIVPMALALEEMGFVRYAGKNNVPSLFKKGVVSNQIDARTMKLKNKVPFDEFKQAKYMILSGDKYFSQDNAEDIKIATSKINMYGDEVRVILISRAASEGLDFKFIRQVHVLDPWYNLNRTEQIIGRGVRNRSHCGLAFEERNVEIYLHATTNGEQETADIYVYRYAEIKAVKIGKVTRLLKTVSVDCVLNHSQTNFTTNKMEAVAKNGIVEIMPSTKDEMVEYKLGDKSFSEICDYMEDCEYKCYPEDAETKLKKKEIINELYDKEQIRVNSKQIVEKIKNIFKTENAYHFETILSMDVFSTATKEELYYGLTELIEGPEMIQDKYGRQGRLVNRGAYYIFQPMEVTNPNISFYESKIPVKTMHEHVQYEIENSDENIKTPLFSMEEEDGDTKSETYDSLIKTIKEKLVSATKDKPNELKDKNDDWYYNLNSIKCNKLEKKTFCDTKDSISVATRLLFLGFTPKTMKKYVTDHILETLSHENQLSLAKEVLKPGFQPKNEPELERQILEYFQFLQINNKKTLILAKNDEIMYYHTSNWSKLNDEEIIMLNNEMTVKMKTDEFKVNHSDIIGFVGEFLSKDMGSTMVFRTKNMTQKRNNKSAFLQNDSSKEAVVQKLNTLLKLANSGFSFDNENCKNCDRNTDDISKIAFAGIYELLIRKLNDENTFGKIWFLKPEQAIFNNIKNM